MLFATFDKDEFSSFPVNGGIWKKTVPWRLPMDMIKDKVTNPTNPVR